jgi:hypothetical protein
MRMIMFARERYIYLINDTLPSVGVELTRAPRERPGAQIQASLYPLVPGVSVAWSSSDGRFSIGLAGVTGGPCTLPLYFYATNGVSDLTLAQVQALVQQLSALPGSRVMLQPQQLDPSLWCGQADPVGIVNTPNRFPNIQE